MRTYFKLFAFIAAAAMFSCSSVQQEDSSAKISGNIPGLANEKIYFKLNNNLDSIEIDQNGNFTKSINLENGDLVLFYDLKEDGAKRVYLDKGFDLTMTFNSQLEGEKSLEKIELSGKGADYTKYSLAKRDFDKANNLYRTITQLAPEAFIAKLDSFEVAANTLVESFNLDNQQFIKDEKDKIKYDHLLVLMSYDVIHARHTPEGVTEVLDEKYTKRLEDAVVDSDEMASNDNYYNFVESYLRSSFSKTFDRKSGQDYFTSFKNSFYDRIKSLRLREKFIYNSIVTSLDYLNEDVQEFLIAEYKSLSTSEKDMKNVEVAYQNAVKIRKGQDSYTWTFKDADGNDHSSTDYVGKMLYIDIWATWCGPCRAQTPYMVQLEKDYRGKDIHFVSISIDHDKEAWVKMVKEENLVWDQVITPNAGQNEMLNYYGVRGIPRFMLFDKNGKIIDANAPLPYDKKIREMIDENL